MRRPSAVAPCGNASASVFSTAAVAGAESLTAYVRERTASSTAKLTVVRDGKVLNVTVTLAAKAATVDQSSGQGSSGSNGSGQNGQNNQDPNSQNPLAPFGLG